MHSLRPYRKTYNASQSVAYRGWGGGWVLTPLPPKIRRPSKIVPNTTRLWKLLNIAEFRTPTPQDIRKKGSKILKLPSVRTCFTLAMTNKLIVIINGHKVPKMKKILLYEMKFIVPNYSPQIPVLSVLCPQLNLLNPPHRTKFLGTPLTISTVDTELAQLYRLQCEKLKTGKVNTDCHVLWKTVVFLILYQYCAGDKMEKNEMGWSCGVYGWGEGCV